MKQAAAVALALLVYLPVGLVILAGLLAAGVVLFAIEAGRAWVSKPQPNERSARQRLDDALH